MFLVIYLPVAVIVWMAMQFALAFNMEFCRRFMFYELSWKWRFQKNLIGPWRDEAFMALVALGWPMTVPFFLVINLVIAGLLSMERFLDSEEKLF